MVGPLLVVLAFLAGIVASLVLSLVTSLLAYWGPHGHSYFLGGNSALQFSSELAPAFVSAGWTALAMHGRRHRHALLLGLGAGLVGAVLLSAYWAIAILTGREFGLAVLALLWTLAAPILALTLPIKGAASLRPGRINYWYLLAAAVVLLAIALPTVGLQACGPSLGLPESPRTFTLCVPFSG